ncbi:hypothetical protein G9A89_015393 [Geosiphon pyriformis]|nr:hypothetical protein G9A89_015393 [Geosiphon pyriformis]
MNPEVFPIDLTVDRDLVGGVLRAILHTILFYRVYTNVKPKDVDFLEITYAAIDDPEIEKEVNEKVKQFERNLESHASQKGQYIFKKNEEFNTSPKIAVMFHEKRTKKAWFSKSEEEICWEQWAITIKTIVCRREIDQLKMRKDMNKQLNYCLLNIIRFVNEKKDHIPPITEDNKKNPFPYQIVIPATDDSWGSMLKRML